MNFIKLFQDVGIKDIALVGGKNASIGEMMQHIKPLGIKMPDGFIITANAYLEHLKTNNLQEKISQLISKITKKDLLSLATIGHQIRSLIANAPLPENIEHEIKESYRKMEKQYGALCAVAVRSSATAEDLPQASFAGQQETFLNIKGEDELIAACRAAFASLFTSRAISYRIDHGFNHMQVALSIGVQKMIRSDLASAGVIFTLDTESGHKNVIFINSSYGLGESVVQGTVNPDEFYVHKSTLEKGFKPILKKRVGNKRTKVVYADDQKNPVKTVSVPARQQSLFSLTDSEILDLAKQSLAIEKLYSKQKGSWCPMDIEWAKDGEDGSLYILQARPETVHSLKQEKSYHEEYVLSSPIHELLDKILVTGKSVGRKIATGKAHVILDVSEMQKVLEGEILVTDMTDPDWEPIMKRAAGIVTNKGGRTCHAAIVSRELGIPAIVGTTDATHKIKTGDIVTIDCSSGEVGTIYQNAIPFEITKIEVKKVPHPKVNIMMNVGNPDEAFNFSLLPNDGVGLARLEFIINSSIQIHPMALVHPEKVTDTKTADKIAKLTAGYADKKQYFIDKLAQEAGTIAAAFYPKPVIIRLSDFKSNEYCKLIGGQYFEPEEANPMLGFRGASRYCHDKYKAAFKLECLAMKKIREEMGFENVKLMVPFVRTVAEGKAVLNEMKKYGIDKTEIYMMCEVPSNVILLEKFSKLFDGFSIGSNDLTQLTLAVDRDSDLVAHLFDERDEAVKAMLALAIEKAKASNKRIGICGQAPSDYPELAKFLIDCGIDSLSLNPDTVLKEMLVLSH